MTQLGSHEENFAQAGLQAVAVGIGKPQHATRYCGKLTPNTLCLTDETTHSHTTYGLRQGTIKDLASAGLFKATARAFRSGSRQGQATGDVRMLPGTFIVDQEGIIQYVHYSAHAGDHPDIQALLKAGAALLEPVGA